MKIYFAGSIRGGRDDQELYALILAELARYGVVLTEHIGDRMILNTGEDSLSDAYIYERDMDWIREADVVVAEVTTPSLGVGYEIGVIEGKKSILCLFREQEGKKVSAMIAGNKNLNIQKYSDIESVRNILKEFFTGLTI